MPVWFVFYIPIFISVIYGQLSPIILVSLAFTFGSLSKKPFGAGLLAGLLFIKPQFLILSLIPALVTSKRKLYLSGLLTSLASLILVSSMLYGFNFVPDYAHFLLDSERFTAGTNIKENYNIQTIYAYLTNSVEPNIYGTYLALLGLGTYLVILAILHRQKLPSDTIIAIGINSSNDIICHTCRFVVGFTSYRLYKGEVIFHCFYSFT